MRKRHKRRKTIPRQFFHTVEEWDKFIVDMKPGTMATVINEKLIVLPFNWRGVMRDV